MKATISADGTIALVRFNCGRPHQVITRVEGSGLAFTDAIGKDFGAVMATRGTGWTEVSGTMDDITEAMEEAFAPTHAKKLWGMAIDAATHPSSKQTALVSLESLFNARPAVHKAIVDDHAGAPQVEGANFTWVRNAIDGHTFDRVRQLLDAHLA